ncbi:MAG TPA: ATP-binding protein [Candidatus Limnocylindria bacterium]
MALPVTLVVLSGLPGSGKSSVARELARALEFSLFELDHIEAPILARFDGDALGWGGYEILSALAEDNLSLGRSVVLDSVAWTNPLREEWRMMAARHRARYRPIEVVVPDRELHRTRVTARTAKNDWPRLEAAFKLYEAWSGDRLVLDSSQPLDALLAAAIAYVRSESV